MAAEPTILERVSQQAERVHISIGAVCNNNCIFCMEEDRDGRYVNNSAMTAERVRWILEENRGAEEVCFTSGEPTTRPELPDFVAQARALGYRPHQRHDQRPPPQPPAVRRRAGQGGDEPVLHLHPRPHQEAPRGPDPHARELRADGGRARRGRASSSASASSCTPRRSSPTATCRTCSTSTASSARTGSIRSSST